MSIHERSDRQKLFDKYEVLEPLGSGGMATVFRARLLAAGGATRPLALKLIHAHLSRDPTFIRLFIEESRIAMPLSHRNIVQTFDAGEIDGRHFLAMELVDGCSLSEMLRRLADAQRGLPIEIALFVGVEICAALAYAHGFAPELTGQPGAVIHRDVSPSNILLSLQGDVKLADFGVARALTAAAQTVSEVIKGKLSYMPPEQGRGRAEPRSDLFALGTVLYRLLTGRLVRDAPSLEQVLEGPREPPSIREANEEVSAALERLIFDCLAAAPDDRPANAAALGDALAHELFALQRDRGERLDPRAGLRALLAELPPLPKSASSEGIARAVLAEAQGVPSLQPEERGAKTGVTVKGGWGDGPGIAPHTAVTVPSRPPWPAATGRRRAAMLIGAVALAIGAASGLGLALFSGGEQRGGQPPGPQRPPRQRGSAAGVAAASPSPDSRPSAGDSRIPADAGLRVEQASRAADAGRAPAARRSARRRAPRGPSARGSSPASQAKPGWLEINSVPWSRVHVGGTYRADTPLQGLELPPGTHRLWLINPHSRRSASLEVEIRSGETTRKVVHLGPAESD